MGFFEPFVRRGISRAGARNPGKMRFSLAYLKKAGAIFGS